MLRKPPRGGENGKAEWKNFEFRQGRHAAAKQIGKSSSARLQLVTLKIRVDVLHAYRAANLANELYNSNQAKNQRDHFGSASHFGTPMIVNGRVYVGTTNGVTVFGLLRH
jgi:hypothetical protein